MTGASSRSGSPAGTRCAFRSTISRATTPATRPLLPSCTARTSASCCATSTTPTVRVDDIAGICNEAGNVVGLMPHPERASDPLLGSTDGQALFGRCWQPRSRQRHRPQQRRSGLQGPGRARQAGAPSVSS